MDGDAVNNSKGHIVDNTITPRAVRRQAGRMTSGCATHLVAYRSVTAGDASTSYLEDSPVIIRRALSCYKPPSKRRRGYLIPVNAQVNSRNPALVTLNSLACNFLATCFGMEL